MADYDTTSLAGGIGQGLDQFERAYQNGKIADNIVKVNPEMLQMLGMSKEQFGAMSAQDRATHVTGLITAMGVRSQQQQMAAKQQEMQAQAEDRLAQAQQRRQLAANQAAVEGFGRDFANGPQTTTADGTPIGMPRGFTGPAAPSPQDLETAAGTPTPQARANYALSRNPGVLADRNFAQNLDAIQAMGGDTAGNFQEDPVSGMRFYTKGKQVLASGMNPAKVQAPQATTMYDEQGNDTGLVAAWDPSTKKLIVKAKPRDMTGALQPVIDPTTKKAVPGFGVDAAGKVHDFRNLMQKMSGGGAESKAPGSAGPLSKDQAKQFLQEAGGDVEKARQAAKAAGYTL